MYLSCNLKTISDIWNQYPCSQVLTVNFMPWVWLQVCFFKVLGLGLCPFYNVCFFFFSNFTNINPAFDTQSDDSNYSYQPICILKNSQKIFGKKFIVSLGKSVALNNIILSWTKNGNIVLIVEAFWASTICTYQKLSCRLNQSLCSSVLTLIHNFQLNRYHYNI